MENISGEKSEKRPIFCLYSSVGKLKKSMVKDTFFLPKTKLWRKNKEKLGNRVRKIAFEQRKEKKNVSGSRPSVSVSELGNSAENRIWNILDFFPKATIQKIFRYFPIPNRSLDYNQKTFFSGE